MSKKDDRESGFHERRSGSFLDSFEEPEGAVGGNPTASGHEEEPVQFGPQSRPTADSFAEHRGGTPFLLTDSDSSDTSSVASRGQDWWDVDTDDEMAKQDVTIKTAVDLPVYSGHPIHTKYQGKDGQSTEIYKVQNWLYEIAKIGRAGSWSDETIATQAAMKLVPQSPAYNWLKVVEQSGDDARINELKTWATFEKAMTREFGAPTDFGTLVSLLQSFRQESNELVRDFYNRLVLGFNEFNLSLPDVFEGPPFDGETDEQVTRRKLITNRVTTFNLRAFFVAGLRPELRKKIIEAGPKNTDEILEMAKRFEQSRLQDKKDKAPSSIPANVLASAVSAELARLGYATTAGAAPTAPVAAAASKTKPKEKKVSSDVICFYDGVAGHLASKCERRAADRARGVWRPTINDPELTRAQWEALTKEERSKGSQKWQKPAAAAAAPPQPSAPPASYSGAVNTRPLEMDYAEYMRQISPSGN